MLRPQPVVLAHRLSKKNQLLWPRQTLIPLSRQGSLHYLLENTVADISSGKTVAEDHHLQTEANREASNLVCVAVGEQIPRTAVVVLRHARCVAPGFMGQRTLQTAIPTSHWQNVQFQTMKTARKSILRSLCNVQNC